MVIFMGCNVVDNSKLLKKEQRRSERKKKIIDRLFKRIFLSAILLLILCLCDNLKLSKLNVKKALNYNLNFMKITKIFNGSLGFFTPTGNEQTVYHKEAYDYSYFDGQYNNIQNITTDGVTSLTSGIVVRIERVNNLYNMFILDLSGTLYGYYDLEVIDYGIYEYINQGEIIGKSLYDYEFTVFKFRLTIEYMGQYYDYYQKAENKD